MGVMIGVIKISDLGFADDIVLVTDCLKKAEGLQNISHTWALANKLSFNTSKCKVMVLNGPRCNIILKLNNEKLQIVHRFKYLGVTLDAKRITNLFKTHFSLMLEKTKTRVAMIRRFGFREDGLRLTTSIRLYTLLHSKTHP